jgi:DNA-binding transcriptional ArsR family regulator
MLKEYLKFWGVDTQLLKAIANPRRSAILGLVWERERSAGEIAAQFDVSWPAISQNLAILHRAGAITERRDGRRRLYRADMTALGPLAEVVQAMWATDLETLRLLAEADDRGRPT